jgi:hypothetical protein
MAGTNLMRDERIYQMHEANVRRTLLLLSQFEFLQTKIQAYEEVLSTPWLSVQAIFNPAWARRVVDNRQLELLAQRKEAFQKASMMSKIVSVAGNGAHG